VSCKKWEYVHPTEKGRIVMYKWENPAKSRRVGISACSQFKELELKNKYAKIRRYPETILYLFQACLHIHNSEMWICKQMGFNV